MATSSRCPFSMFSWGEIGKGSKLSRFLTVDADPIPRTLLSLISSKPNYFSEAPSPNTSTLGVLVSTLSVEGTPFSLYGVRELCAYGNRVTEVPMVVRGSRFMVRPCADLNFGTG